MLVMMGCLGKEYLRVTAIALTEIGEPRSKTYRPQVHSHCARSVTWVASVTNFRLFVNAARIHDHGIPLTPETAGTKCYMFNPAIWSKMQQKTINLTLHIRGQLLVYYYVIYNVEALAVLHFALHNLSLSRLQVLFCNLERMCTVVAQSIQLPSI